MNGFVVSRIRNCVHRRGKLHPTHPLLTETKKEKTPNKKTSKSKFPEMPRWKSHKLHIIFPLQIDRDLIRLPWSLVAVAGPEHLFLGFRAALAFGYYCLVERLV